MVPLLIAYLFCSVIVFGFLISYVVSKKVFLKKLIIISCITSVLFLSIVAIDNKISRKAKRDHFITKLMNEITFEWWNSRLIAHAGGAVFGDNGEMIVYTNSLEAILLNYNKGHRVFEIDFDFTSDGKLAAVHDWKMGAEMTGAFFDVGGPSLEDWYRKKIRGKYTPIGIYEIIKLMGEKKDMYLVTDIKSRNPEIVKNSFLEIYKTAKQYDLQILDRVIPQIYEPEMLLMVQSVYKFPSIIYTLYKFKPSPVDVVDFVKDYDEIKVITMRPRMATQEFVSELLSLDKLVYCHTINNFSEAIELYERGVYGFYTDYLY